MVKRGLILALSLFATTPVLAEEPWTEFGICLFATDIDGELARLGVDLDYTGLMFGASYRL